MSKAQKAIEAMGAVARARTRVRRVIDIPPKMDGSHLVLGEFERESLVEAVWFLNEAFGVLREIRDEQSPESD